MNKDQITTIRLTEDQAKFLQDMAKKYKQESIASTIRMIIEDFKEKLGGHYEQKD
jgi:sulfur relay (sulfurtransferase) DsrC/TusE family protein